MPYDPKTHEPILRNPEPGEQFTGPQYWGSQLRDLARLIRDVLMADQDAPTRADESRGTTIGRFIKSGAEIPLAIAPFVPGRAGIRHGAADPGWRKAIENAIPEALKPRSTPVRRTEAFKVFRDMAGEEAAGGNQYAMDIVRRAMEPATWKIAHRYGRPTREFGGQIFEPSAGASEIQRAAMESLIKNLPKYQRSEGPLDKFLYPQMNRDAARYATRIKRPTSGIEERDALTKFIFGEADKFKRRFGSDPSPEFLAIKHRDRLTSMGIQPDRTRDTVRAILEGREHFPRGESLTEASPEAQLRAIERFTGESKPRAKTPANTVIDPNANPLEALLQREEIGRGGSRLDQIQQAMERLNPETRKLLELKYSNTPAAEGMKITGLSRRTYFRRLAEAEAELRRTVKPIAGGSGPLDTQGENQRMLDAMEQRLAGLELRGQQSKRESVKPDPLADYIREWSEAAGTNLPAPHLEKSRRFQSDPKKSQVLESIRQGARDLTSGTRFPNDKDLIEAPHEPGDTRLGFGSAVEKGWLERMIQDYIEQGLGRRAPTQQPAHREGDLNFEQLMSITPKVNTEGPTSPWGRQQ